MKKDDLAYLLALWRTPDVGPVKFLRVLQEEISIKNYLEKAAINIDWKLIDNDLKWAEAPDHNILTYQDELYPARLKEISSAPPLLFVEGDVNLLSKPQIAMVGSRHPTPSGLDTAHQFAKTFAQNGWIITSGLALGIDAACHEGALEAEGKTIAVMGTGPDQIYPKRHQALARKIRENGCIISEFPTGVTPIAMNFPRRNRIISGLSQGVLVVEAAFASGSLVTAKYALEQNREVFAIPGSIHNPLARGCHALIKQGAKLVETAQDVLEELQSLDFPPYPSFGPPVSRAKQALLPQEGKEKIFHPFLKNIDFNLTPMDLIIERSALTAEEVSSILLLLEIEGHVKSVPGGYQRVN
jgi:DNA processing protein